MTDAPPRPGGTAGFTLIELMAVMLVVLIATSLWLRGPQPVSPRQVHGYAQLVRAGMTRALAEAGGRQGDAVFYLDPAVVGGRRGRFLALAGPAGTTRDTLPADHDGWLELLEDVQWGWGSAAAGPDGAPPARMPGTIRCTADGGCDLGGREQATLYLTHARDSLSVEAVVLSRGGNVQIFHFQAGTRRWTPSLQ
ncbi:MAG TPA: prepilin-type N-terminal cleavage/methylation domain-containing protein [Longimicrobiaceae bacterium]